MADAATGVNPSRAAPACADRKSFGCWPLGYERPHRRTAISNLPSSLSCCINLRMLSLNYCRRLQFLPPALEAGLHCLQVLSLRGTPLPQVTRLALHNKPDLKTLHFSHALHNLEEFELSVNNGRVFEEYRRGTTQRRRGYRAPLIQRAHLSIHHADLDTGDQLDRSSCSRRHRRLLTVREKFPMYARVHNQSICPSIRREEPRAWKRHLEVHGGEEDVLTYKIAHTICRPDFLSLCNNQANMLISLRAFKELAVCRIQRCHQMRTAFSIDSEQEAHLEKIFLSCLRMLTYMASCTSVVSLTHLRNIHIACCPNLVCLFNYGIIRATAGTEGAGDQVLRQVAARLRQKTRRDPSP